MNSIPVEMPWLTMYSIAPEHACEENEKMPNAMKPKCAIEV